MSRRPPHRFTWPAVTAWLLVLGAADGIVFGASLAHRSRPGLVTFALLVLASLTWGNRHAP